MTEDEIREIVECLPKGKTVFHYFRDRYAAILLDLAVRGRATVAQVKQSRFAPLLRKPLVKKLLACRGDGDVDGELFRCAWADPAEPYLLGLTKWGEERRRLPRFNYHQTSRPGLNLVLQLNFTSHHERPSAKWLAREREEHPFVWDLHPVSQHPRRTLAWARLDIDLASDEALIEEIQSDWVREATYLLGILAVLSSDHQRTSYLQRYYSGISLLGIRRYADTVFPFHARFWAEAMLSAAIWFLRREIGIRHVYYHTFDGGVRLKRMEYSEPPRSLYTDLPRRFCFEKTREPPRMLDDSTDWRVRAAVRSGEIEFHRLSF